MKTPLLFDIPESLSPQLQRLRDWKAQGIQTHYCAGLDHPWMAINMPKAVEFLSGYGLDEGEKTNIGLMVAGYGRLLEEAGFIHEEKTEYDAVEAAAS